MNDTCDRCGKTEDGIDSFGAANRRKELRNGRPDPGNLCGSCAGSDTGKRIARELAEVLEVGDLLPRAVSSSTSGAKETP